MGWLLMGHCILHCVIIDCQSGKGRDCVKVVLKIETAGTLSDTTGTEPRTWPVGSSCIKWSAYVV